MTIRIDSVASAGERDLTDLQRSAAEIFRHAGIDIIWLNCWPTCAQCSTLAQLNGPAQTVVRLRIVDRLDRGTVHVLAWTIPDSRATTIQYKRAQEMARASTVGVSAGQILGRVAAHEIGHLLLASNTHAAIGVMKSVYDEQDLVNIAQGQLLFTMQESRVLRARLSSIFGPHAKMLLPSSPECTCSRK